MGAFELLAYAGALAALAAYVVNYARRPTAGRLLSSSGLFFTAAALAVLPTGAGDASGNPELWLTLGFLLLAALAQAVAALRVRPPRDGRQDRASDRMNEAT